MKAEYSGFGMVITQRVSIEELPIEERRALLRDLLRFYIPHKTRAYHEMYVDAAQVIYDILCLGGAPDIPGLEKDLENLE